MTATIQTVCHVDFFSDLRETTCGMPLLDDSGELAVKTTLFLSSTTCPRCQHKIQLRIGAIALPEKAETATERVTVSELLLPLAGELKTNVPRQARYVNS